MDTYIDAWCQLGAPLMGSPQAATSLLLGDDMGLGALLMRGRESLVLTRSMGSAPWLLPGANTGVNERCRMFLREDGMLRVTLLGPFRATPTQPAF